MRVTCSLPFLPLSLLFAPVIFIRLMRVFRSLLTSQSHPFNLACNNIYIQTFARLRHHLNVHQCVKSFAFPPLSNPVPCYVLFVEKSEIIFRLACFSNGFNLRRWIKKQFNRALKQLSFCYVVRVNGKRDCFTRVAFFYVKRSASCLILSSTLSTLILLQ